MAADIESVGMAAIADIAAEGGDMAAEEEVMAATDVQAIGAEGAESTAIADIAAEGGDMAQTAPIQPATIPKGHTIFKSRTLSNF